VVVRFVVIGWIVDLSLFTCKISFRNTCIYQKPLMKISTNSFRGQLYILTAILNIQ
jgi:hypothetical protein